MAENGEFNQNIPVMGRIATLPHPATNLRVVFDTDEKSNEPDCNFVRDKFNRKRKLYQLPSQYIGMYTTPGDLYRLEYLYDDSFTLYPCYVEIIDGGDEGDNEDNHEEEEGEGDDCIWWSGPEFTNGIPVMGIIATLPRPATHLKLVLATNEKCNEPDCNFVRDTYNRTRKRIDGPARYTGAYTTPGSLHIWEHQRDEIDDLTFFIEIIGGGDERGGTGAFSGSFSSLSL